MCEYKIAILFFSVKIRIMNKVTVYNPARDVNNFIFSNIWRYVRFGIDYTFDKDNEEELDVNIIKVKEQFPELAMQIYVGDYLKNVQRNKNDELEFEVKKNSGGPDSILVRIIFNDASGFERKIGIRL